MFVENINVLGERADKEQVIGLLSMCIENAPDVKNKKAALLLDCEAAEKLPDTDFDGIAAPMGAVSALSANAEQNIVSYSADDMSAKLSALNIQGKPDYVCFELISGTYMGRVFVSRDKKYSVETVLSVAATLMACNVELAEVIKILNLKLRN